MTKRLFSVLLATLLCGTLCLMAQDFDPKQGYRLEIGDGLALDCLSGTLTFSPANKKSQTQVWQIKKSDRPGYFISSAEVHFLLAEALSKNWTVPGSMKGHFEAGIRESMQMLNTHYLSNSLKISDAEISDYINNIEHKYSLDDHPREVINTQAYILHLMNPSEAWANLRRADYPVLKDRRTIEKWSSQFKYPDEDLSTPDRLGYPTEEKDYNGDNWREALDRMDGTDSWHNRVWWDKDHGHFE